MVDGGGRAGGDDGGVRLARRCSGYWRRRADVALLGLILRNRHFSLNSGEVALFYTGYSIIFHGSIEANFLSQLT